MIDFKGLAADMRLDALYTHLMGMEQRRRGAGYRRAQKRLREKQAANRLIPSTDRRTRQRDRYIARLLAKRARIEDMENFKQVSGGTALRPSWRHYAAP